MLRPKIGFKPVFREGRLHAKACWDGQPKRCPKAGEYFISGALPAAYLAKHDLTTEYFIAVPIEE